MTAAFSQRRSSRRALAPSSRHSASWTRWRRPSTVRRARNRRPRHCNRITLRRWLRRRRSRMPRECRWMTRAAKCILAMCRRTTCDFITARILDTGSVIWLTTMTRILRCRQTLHNFTCTNLRARNRFRSHRPRNQLWMVLAALRDLEMCLLVRKPRMRVWTLFALSDLSFWPMLFLILRNTRCINTTDRSCFL